MSITRSSFVGFILLGLLVLVLLLLALFSQQPQQTQQHAATSSISNHVPGGISPGFGFENLFENMSSSQQQTVINNMKSDGVQWLRLDYYPNTSYDYQFIKDAESADINVDVLLEDFTGTPKEFANFGTQAVTTFGPLGVHTYEILNEVNTYTPKITAAQYVPRLKAAYTAIKAADPSATVLMSGLDFSGKPNMYLQAMYDDGAKGFFDAVSAHPYSFLDGPAPVNCSNSNAFCHGLPALYAVMQQNGDSNKKIWITEFGCPTGTDAGHLAACTDATLAQQITQAFNRASAWRWTGPLFIFSWQDNTKDGDFGLYYATGSPKTAALAAFRYGPTKLDFIHISDLQKVSGQKCCDAREAASLASKRRELEGSLLSRDILNLLSCLASESERINDALKECTRNFYHIGF